MKYHSEPMAVEDVILEYIMYFTRFSVVQNNTDIVGRFTVSIF